MRQRLILNLILAALWLAFAAALYFGVRIGGRLWQSTPAAALALAMVLWNLLRAWMAAKSPPRET